MNGSLPAPSKHPARMFLYPPFDGYARDSFSSFSGQR